MKTYVFVCIAIILAVASAKKAEITHRVYFDVELEGGTKLGRIEMGLFGELLPKTVENFFQIASNRNPDATYKDTIFHRVIQQFMIQGGDVSYKASDSSTHSHMPGTGSFSIYGSQFDDEGFPIKHIRPGLLSMANRGPNTNGSQFFITTVATPWLDGKHMVFGMVTKGMSIVKQIEKMEGNAQNRPAVDVIIADCGVLEEPSH